MALRLQCTEMVTAQRREGETGPACRYYRIIDAGGAVLRRTATGWEVFAHAVNALLRKVVIR
ncbi:hypothetical protein [Thermomonospora cellulosilytica]|uniref:DNA-binding PadR family transcriptional regulator n=1 Tax=Thermomonospora cellulosilytica TaxID=1411118 RepID=A0A7W3R9S3_9ACTN|nr:hypothetical protein [Thermomonospora cellulosilytica]MBA9005071.1 DNA-binding PadR family transcriptional regulator [Thermomonospora cellulosilytica]